MSLKICPKVCFPFASIPSIQAYFLHFHRLPPPSTLDMLVPANAVGKVMGKGGANIANIRKVCSSVFFFFSLVFFS